MNERPEKQIIQSKKNYNKQRIIFSDLRVQQESIQPSKTETIEPGFLSRYTTKLLIHKIGERHETIFDQIQKTTRDKRKEQAKT